MNVAARPERKSTVGPAAEIYALARRHGVTFRRTESDDLADDFARVSDAEANLDEPALLLIALERAGHLNRQEAMRLHGDYLRAKYE
jgi:hypothetical protein